MRDITWNNYSYIPFCDSISKDPVDCRFFLYYSCITSRHISLDSDCVLSMTVMVDSCGFCCSN